jgi:glycerol-3-phosphate dehydrogenase
VATREDIDYILDHANAVLDPPIGHDDIIGVYAGLRPLLQPGTKGDDSASTKVSREHTVTEAAPGLTVIAGGKLTTYRQMAEDAVDFTLGPRARAMPSVTARTPLVGAAGFTATKQRRAQIAARYGWTSERVEHLFHRYGSEIATILEMIDADPELGRPLQSADAYLAAEVAFAATHEGVLHLEDILLHRIRLSYETRDRGLSALEEIAGIAGPLLGWDPARTEREIAGYRRQAEAEIAAEREQSDESAAKARLRVEDVVPVRDLGPIDPDD